MSAQPQNRQAMLVIHGVGQQQSFQVLDSFTRGLRYTLDAAGKASTQTHHFIGEGPFDHRISVDGDGLALDIYEYHWAPKTQGKASFKGVLRWLQVTALTPLERFAFNMQLLLDRSRSVEHADRPGATLKDRVKSRLGLYYEYGMEAWRLFWIPWLFLAIAAGAGLLVYQSWPIPGELFGAVTRVAGPYLTPDSNGLINTFTLGLSVISFVAFLAILYSLPEQMDDYIQVQRWARPVRKQIDVSKGEWAVEAPGRRKLLWLSLGTLVVMAGVAALPLVGFPSPIVQDILKVLQGNGWVHYFAPLGLLLLAVAVKKVFVDFLADVALYTTADENSSFYGTRMEILTEATHRLYWLLDQYETVSLAGHSLGSVIAYDAICKLRVEQAVPGASSQSSTAGCAAFPGVKLGKLKAFVTFGCPLNKVIYFFRAKIRPYETIRAHILNELHGFRRLSEGRGDPLLQDQQTLDPMKGLRWLNVYSLMDPVSAELVGFRDVQDESMHYPIWFLGFCHTRYWKDPKFYEKILAVVCAA